MIKRDMHVVPRGGKWAVVREGNDRAISLHDTQRDALENGREIARRDKVKLVTHRPNEQIRDLR